MLLAMELIDIIWIAGSGFVTLLLVIIAWLIRNGIVFVKKVWTERTEWHEKKEKAQKEFNDNITLQCKGVKEALSEILPIVPLVWKHEEQLNPKEKK